MEVKKHHPILELGRGGMAEVLLAATLGHGGFTKLVVLKRVRDELSQDPEFVSMFLDEARLAARLNHPNVVQTYEVGEEDGRYFTSMEYLDGQPLSRARGLQAKPMPLPLQVHVLREVLAGLHHAHELCDFDGTPLDVVHRDISPHNIFVTYEGHVKVVDFGIAKVSGAASRTQAGEIKGKLAYMPPEQATGQEVDRRSDLFAVGVLLWEAIAGKRMWAAVPESGILFRLGAHQLPDLAGSCPEVAPELLAVVRKALAPSREDRFSTAAEMSAALEAFMVASSWRVTAKELGDHMKKNFAEQRVRAQQAIEAQLRSIKEETSERSLPRMPVSLRETSSPSGSSRTNKSGTLSPLGLAQAEQPSQRTVRSSPPSARPAVGWRGAVGLGAFLLGLGLAVLVQRRDPAPGAPARGSAPVASGGAAAGQEPPAASMAAAPAVAASSVAPAQAPAPAASGPAQGKERGESPAKPAARRPSGPAPESSVRAPSASADRAAFGGRK